jgi:hypothetical protein
MAAAMLRPYFLVTAATLDRRADRLEIQRRSSKNEPT